jgi:hypothetical protein
MQNHLRNVLIRIGNNYKEDISSGSRFYREVNIGEQGERLGYTDVHEKYAGVNAIVPLSRPVSGMKVRVDGRTFTNYAQFESGVVVAGYIAKESGLPYRTYIPNDSMIRNFAEG